jgi:DNA polymerase III psi subunit
MEPLNLHHLSLFLDQDLIIIPDDSTKHLLSEQLRARYSPINEEADISSEPSALEAEEEYREEILKINYEGDFEKGVLIIYQGNHLEASYREFLMKILGAVGCSLKDVAMVSTNHIHELPSECISQLNPNKYLVFGSLNHPIMKLKTNNYEVISLEAAYLFADPLEELSDNVQLKKKLWTGLQVLFNIKK